MASDWELVNVQDGCCTCESVYESVKSKKKKGAFTRSNWSIWFTRVPGIEFVPDAVAWRQKSTGRTEYRRGLTLNGFKSAVRRLCNLGHIEPGVYVYPHFFGLPPGDRYVVSGNGGPPQEQTDQAQTDQVQNEESKTEFYREDWTSDARSIIAQHVQGKSASPSEIVSQLVEQGHRRPGLTEKTLSRQMTRMVGIYYPEEALKEYKRKYVPRGLRARRGVYKDKAPSRSKWLRPQDVALIDVAEHTQLTDNGTVNVKRITTGFRKLNLRVVKTHQTIRHRLDDLAHSEYGKELGMTIELWDRINVTKKHKEGERPAEPAPSVKSGVVTLKVRGIEVKLTPEQQKQALEEFLTDKTKKEAFKKFVSGKLS